MGFVKMRKNFGHHMRLVLWGIIIVFTIGIFFLFSGYNGARGVRDSEETAASAEAIAMVDGQPITRAEFEDRFATQLENAEEQARAQDRDTTIPLFYYEYMRGNVLTQMIQERALVAAAKQQGISVTDREVQRTLQQMIDQQLGTGPVEAERRGYVEAAAKKQTEAVRAELTMQRLRAAVTRQVKASDEDVRKSYRQVKTRHILIAVDASKQRGLPDAQAKQKAEQLLAKLKAGADFATLAKQNSDDKGSAARGGDLGLVSRGQTVPEFEEAAFGLKPGAPPVIVKSPYGYHIIQVVGETFNLPTDFAKKKSDYRRQYIEQEKARVWQTFEQQARDKANVQIKDPEQQGIMAVTSGKTDDAMVYFTKAIQEAAKLPEEARAAIFLIRGQLYGQKNDWKNAVAMYERSLDATTSSLVEVYMALGGAYDKLGDRVKALENYKLAETESPTDAGTHTQLLAAYRKLGDKDGVAREEKWQAEDAQRRAEEQRKAELKAARDKAAAAKPKTGAAAPVKSEAPTPKP